ncbi:hypothetical protein ACWKWZ_13985 [Metapseudomonas otitidis]
MTKKGKLHIKYTLDGRRLEIVVDGPYGADEATVLLHILSTYEGPRLGVDVDWTVKGTDRLWPQAKAIGVSDVAWDYL